MSDSRATKIAKAREMRRQGKLNRETAIALGVPLATVSVWTKGVLPHGRHPVAQRKAEVLPILDRLYRQGSSIPEIARITGVPQPTLFDWRRELGLPKNHRAAYVTDELRDRSRDPDGEAKDWAARFYIENLLSTPEIADILRVSSMTVGTWLKKVGVRIRTEVPVRVREKLREANLGSKRWNWKGGITPDRVRLRACLDMKLARESCFERDDYTCRSCRQHGGKLNAHHIWPFQRFPEWKFELWNLMTLCKRCHDAFHNAAGGAVRMAIGPFFSTPNELRESPAEGAHPVAA